MATPTGATGNLLRLFAAAVSCLPVSGQYVISARPGLIHYAEGRVFLNGKPVPQQGGTSLEMKEAGELRTEQGRAEVLLNPGVFLRMAENSVVRMRSNNLADSRIEFVSGAAVIDRSGLVKDEEVRMSPNSGVPTATVGRFSYCNRGNR
jgi:hypothetical protein